jgi:hypothetical protein
VVAVTDQTQNTLGRVQATAYASLCAVSRFDLRIGGALITCLRSFRNLRYSGVFLNSAFSSSTLSFGFGSDITPQLAEAVAERVARRIKPESSVRLTGEFPQSIMTVESPRFRDGGLWPVSKTVQ